MSRKSRNSSSKKSSKKTAPQKSAPPKEQKEKHKAASSAGGSGGPKDAAAKDAPSPGRGAPAKAAGAAQGAGKGAGFAAKKSAAKAAPKSSPKKAPSKKAPPKKPAAARRLFLSGAFSGALARVDIANVILIVILAFLGYIIISGPFQRGLFFPRELLPVHVISFALFIAWVVSRLLRREGSFLKTPLDWCAFALLFFYLLSLIPAVNRREALGEFLKVANYFVVYLLVFDICRRSDLFKIIKGKPGSEEPGGGLKGLLAKAFRQPPPAADSGSVKGRGSGKDAAGAGKGLPAAAPQGPLPALTGSGRLSFPLLLVLHLLLAAGTAVALGGLGAAVGTWEIHGAYVGARIHTALQYPNTAAAYLTAAYFLALGLALLAPRWYLRPLYLVPAIIIFITFVFTYSRGAWMLMPFLALLFVLLAGRGNRLRVFLYLFLSGLLTIALALPLDEALRAGDAGALWPYLFVAVALVAGGGILIELFARLGWKLQAAAAAAAAALLIILGLQALLPQLRAPLHLERGAAEDPSSEYLEQRVGNITGGQRYLLSLEVNAVKEELPLEPDEEDERDYAWRLLVRGYDLEEQRSTVLDHREGPTDGWELRELELLPEEEIQRLEVRLYNRYPGTAVTARNVTLHEEGGAQRGLSFALHRVLPGGVYNRIHALGTGERSAEARFMFYRDALKIVRDYPLLGAGGGGWESLYFGYQEERYFTTEVHNHYLQVWVEAGTLGMLAFAGVWVFFALSFLRAFFNKELPAAAKTCWAAVFTAALALGAHSAIDFNLSLAAVSMFLFALFGVGRALSPEGGGREGSLSARFADLGRKTGELIPARPWSTGAAAIIAAIILLSYSYTLLNGHTLGEKAAQAAAAGNLLQAEQLYQQAAASDPLQASHYMGLARIYERAAELEDNIEAAPQLRGEALRFSEKAVELEPFSSSYNLEHGAMLIRYGELQEGISYLEWALELHPHHVAYFTHLAEAHLAAAQYFQEVNEEERAAEHLDEVLLLEERMEEIQGDADALAFHLGKSAFMRERFAEAEQYLQAVSSRDDNFERARVYLAVIYEQAGREEEASELMEEFQEDEELLRLYEELGGKNS